MDCAPGRAHAAGVTMCLPLPAALSTITSDPVLDDDIDAAALLEFMSRRRRILRDRAYRRLAATILGLDVASLAAGLESRRGSPSAASPAARAYDAA